MVNETRAAIEELLEESKKNMEKKLREEKMKKEVIDVTLPAKKNMVGHRLQEYHCSGRGRENLRGHGHMR